MATTTKTSRRTFGQPRKLPSGRYQARFSQLVDGERVWHKAPSTFATKREAEHWLSQSDVKVAAHAFIDARAGAEPFGPYAEQWLDGRRGIMRPTTMERDQIQVRRHLCAPAPAGFGDVELGAITPAMVRSWLAAQTALGQAPSSVRKRGQLLRAILAMAVKDQKIATNPAGRDMVTLPKAATLELAVLTVPEITRLADVIDQRYRAVVLLGCYAGLRIGEIVGLTVGDLELGERPAVRVVRSVSYVGGTMHEGEPKTAAGRRRVPLPLAVALELAELLNGRHPDDYVVEAPEGGPLFVRTFRRRIWQPAVAKIGRPKFRIHDSRHTAVSQWIAKGATARQVATWAGHSSVATVFDRYGHMFSDGETSVMAALDAELADVLAAPVAVGANVVPMRRGR